MRIFILEDNAERRTAMLEHIADSVPMFGVSFYETSDSIIKALKSVDPQDVALISLDNDLDPIVVNGQLVDAGDGVAVARFLVNRTSDEFGDTECKPPVIIHTTNEQAADAMQDLFTTARWQFDRVIPYGAESWIGEVWIQKVRSMIIRNVSDRKTIAASR
jgi:CheY-like chemotaxis protein